MTRNKTKRMTIKVIESLPGPPDGAKTSNIEYSVAQESNLCLAVYKNGSRSWRFKQKFKGKTKGRYKEKKKNWNNCYFASIRINCKRVFRRSNICQ